MAQQPKEINSDVLVLVEGPDDEQFLKTLIGKLGLTSNFQIERAIGKDQLPELLKALSLTETFVRAKTVLIVRDSDQDLESADAQVKSAFRKSDLPVPNSAGELTAGAPSTGFFLLPSASSKGSVEDLILQALVDNPLMDCVERFAECVKENCESPESFSKLKLQAFLAGTKKASVRGIWTAGEKGYLNLDHPCYDEIREFLKKSIPPSSQ